MKKDEKKDLPVRRAFPKLSFGNCMLLTVTFLENEL